VLSSDAIAGVVNIITKKDFEGFQLDFNGSGTDKGDGENGDVSALYGFNTDGGNYTFGAAYADRRGVIQGDRDWTEPGASSYIPTGTLGGKVQDANGNWVDRTYGYDFTQDSYYQTPNERRSLFANMTQELGNDVVLTADAIYTNRRSNQQMAAQPAEVFLDVCKTAGQKDCLTLDQAMIAGGITANKDDQVSYRRRTNDVGPRIYTQDTDTWRLSGGLAGTLDVHTGMNWDVTYTYGKNQAKTAVENSINGSDMKASVLANQAAWFSGAPLTQQMIDAISYTEEAKGGNEQQTLSAGLNGELFDLSAGAVGFAIGAEYRRESGFYTPDEVVIAGESDYLESWFNLHCD